MTEHIEYHDLGFRRGFTDQEKVALSREKTSVWDKYDWQIKLASACLILSAVIFCVVTVLHLDVARAGSLNYKDIHSKEAVCQYADCILKRFPT